ncbi:hypothetical protein OIDMADRAFT_21001 [Oidiodendron maius Zn]|uniref:Uncharacterized protein n=1 Tax=Oidiodendron maius (strain Zn) TaxID=913774 RepID=A0A0C3GZ80_OIDMZ|nr:hypothetical protein OIDMADRAFT_21001 [Oidiodendron maius Zn]
MAYNDGICDAGSSRNHGEIGRWGYATSASSGRISLPDRSQGNYGVNERTFDRGNGSGGRSQGTVLGQFPARAHPHKIEYRAVGHVSYGLVKRPYISRPSYACS